MAETGGNFERLIVRSLDLVRLAQFKSRFIPRDLILTYHSVESAPSGYKFAVQRDRFEKQINYLQSQVDIVPLAELHRPRTNRRPRIAITFDDAYADFYENVYPLFRQHGIPAVVFVPTLFIGAEQGLLERDEGIAKPHLTWEQMDEIQATSAIEFGSHTHSHWGAVDQIDRLAADVEISVELLETHLGKRPRYFAYPYGQYNEKTHQIVMHCEFDSILTMDDVPLAAGSIQGRLDIYERNQTLPYFKLTTAGLLGPGTRARIRQAFYGR